MRSNAPVHDTARPYRKHVHACYPTSNVARLLQQRLALPRARAGGMVEVCQLVTLRDAKKNMCVPIDPYLTWQTCFSSASRSLVREPVAPWKSASRPHTPGGAPLVPTARASASATARSRAAPSPRSLPARGLARLLQVCIQGSESQRCF